MMKIVCILVIVIVAVAAQSVPFGTRGDQPAAQMSNEIQTPDTTGDLDKAETFGFGYHKHYYHAPRYYGGYYGGYYPHYGHHYGYPSYY